MKKEIEIKKKLEFLQHDLNNNRCLNINTDVEEKELEAQIKILKWVLEE